MFWIELRCDISKGGCYNNTEWPMTSTGNLRRNVLAGSDELRKIALKKGWICTMVGEWICPNCKKAES